MLKLVLEGYTKGSGVAEEPKATRVGLSCYRLFGSIQLIKNWEVESAVHRATHLVLGILL